VNEQQTIANATRSTALQEQVNQQSAVRLSAYAERYEAWALPEGPSAALRACGSVRVDGRLYVPMAADFEGFSPEEAELLELRLTIEEVALLIEEPQKLVKTKNTRVLTLTSRAVRLLHGGRIVSCKSAKDRTSMSITAEQTAILCRRHGLQGHHAQPMLDAMRRGGVRMHNTTKNVGRTGYAFNALQRLLLPTSLRAPADTTLAGLQS